MVSFTEIRQKILFLKECLSLAREAYQKALESGKASYTIGSRSLTNYTPEQIRVEIRQIENEIAETEALYIGRGRRLAVGIVRRDW